MRKWSFFSNTCVYVFGSLIMFPDPMYIKQSPSTNIADVSGFNCSFKNCPDCNIQWVGLFKYTPILYLMCTFLKKFILKIIAFRKIFEFWNINNLCDKTKSITAPESPHLHPIILIHRFFQRFVQKTTLNWIHRGKLPIFLRKPLFLK